MAGGQGGGSRQNRPLTGGMGGAMGGGGPGYGQQQRTAPQMPAQANYQQNAPYQGGFTPGAPGAQMMQAGQAVPFQMNGGMGFGGLGQQPLPMNGGQNYRQQFNQYMRQWQRNHPGQGGGAGTTPTPTTPPAVTPPVTDPNAPPAVDPVTGEPVIGIATDVYGHYQGEDGTGDGTGVTPDPVTGAPRSRHAALAQQIAALRGQMQDRRSTLLGTGVGAIGGPGDPRYEQMQQQMRKLWAQRGRGGGGGNAA